MHFARMGLVTYHVIPSPSTDCGVLVLLGWKPQFFRDKGMLSCASKGAIVSCRFQVLITRLIPACIACTGGAAAAAADC